MTSILLGKSRSKEAVPRLTTSPSKALIEVKSPSVMKKVGELLPAHGIELKWDRNQSLIPKILSKVSALFNVRTTSV